MATTTSYIADYFVHDNGLISYISVMEEGDNTIDCRMECVDGSAIMLDQIQQCMKTDVPEAEPSKTFRGLVHTYKCYNRLFVDARVCPRCDEELEDTCSLISY